MGNRGWPGNIRRVLWLEPGLARTRYRWAANSHVDSNPNVKERYQELN